MPEAVVRFPTMEELDRMFQEQLADELRRAKNPDARPLRDMEAQLVEVGVIDNPEKPTPTFREGCPECGLIFQYTSKGMVAAQLARHRKKHAKES